MKKELGFTLIELVMVIVILGILAAVAMPKFVSFKTDAQTAALAGVAGAIASASDINYATRSLNPLSGVATIGLTCLSAASSVLNGGLPPDYTLSASAIVAGSNTCVVTQANGGTRNTYITGI
ncbi:MAG: type II secretion system protein [Gallionella sp.]|nr:type II secretion system protein [Gallionella sp.]